MLLYLHRKAVQCIVNSVMFLNLASLVMFQ
nr:MAG TPA: hypothetical protein [Bacteriophage sp.]